MSQSTTVSLGQGRTLTVTAGTASGVVIRHGDHPGDGANLGYWSVAVGETLTVGPFITVARLEVVSNSGLLTYVDGPADLTALDMTGGSMEVSDSYADDSSHQVVAIDMELAAAAGGTVPDTAFLAPIMGNILGADLTADGNYLAGVIGADSVTGTKTTALQKGGVIGVAMDGVTAADAPIVSLIDGSDPSSVTRTTAMFAARINNNNAGSGSDYGVDLYDAGRASSLYSGGGVPLAFAKAALRLDNQVCVLTGAGAPSNGTTGDNFAAVGSLYVDVTAGVLYINTGAITNPTWTKVGTQT